MPISNREFTVSTAHSNAAPVGLALALGVCAAKRDKGKRWGGVADFIAKSAAMSDFGT